MRFAAALAHPRGGYSIFIRLLWLFSMSVEAISVLPQLRLIQNAKYLNDLDDLRAKLAVTRATADVFHCFGQYFCLHFEAFQLGMAPVYMAFLRFMGDESEARKYNHSLEVGGYGRKLTWDGPPRSIRDSYRKVRDSHDGLIIQRKLALFFSGEDMKELKLRVTGRISKGDHNSDSGTSF